MAKRQPKVPATIPLAPETSEPQGLTVQVGDMVYTIDRSRFNSAKDRALAPEPFAAIVTRVLFDKVGQRTGQVCLCIFEPNGHVSAGLDVPPAAELTPGHWTPKPLRDRVTIPFQLLTEAVRAAMTLVMATPAEDPAAAEEKSADVTT